MQRVLILCTGNSCRSQMAEAFWESLGAGEWEAESAGSKPSGYVHPLAIQVMAEIGIDLSSHRSKHFDEFVGREVETAITVCDNAAQDCPDFLGQVNRHHYPFADPARATGSEEEQRAVFRTVRDEIVAVFSAYADGRLAEAAASARKGC